MISKQRQGRSDKGFKVVEQKKASFCEEKQMQNAIGKQKV